VVIEVMSFFYLLWRFLRKSDSWPEALCNLQANGSWLAWLNDTTAHYAAICYPRQRTTVPAVCSKQTYHYCQVNFLHGLLSVQPLLTFFRRCSQTMGNHGIAFIYELFEIHGFLLSVL